MRMSVGTNGLFLKLGVYVYSALIQSDARIFDPEM